MYDNGDLELRILLGVDMHFLIDFRMHDKECSAVEFSSDRVLVC